MSGQPIVPEGPGGPAAGGGAGRVPGLVAASATGAGRLRTFEGDRAGEGSDQDLPELIRAFTEPSFHQQEPERVDMLETHVSVLFFAGSLVYKLKKAVDLGFLDHRTLAIRRAVCAEEVRLNARLAPGVYRRVVPVTRESDGSLWLDGDGDVVEAVVEMERLPAAGMLDVLLEHGVMDNELLHELVELLALFHQGASTGPGVDEFGSPAAVSQLVLGNLQELEQLELLPQSLHRHLRARLQEFLEAHRDLLERRVRAGCIREGHGDLHTGNLCRLPAGFVAYDCLEFSKTLRCSDVAADLAFLAMDLDSKGYRAFSRGLVQQYQELTRDRELSYLMTFYKTHRALVRAKVGCLAARQKAPGDRAAESDLEQARHAAQLAVSYQLPPVLVLMSGLPATGKSWFARRVAKPFEARIVRSDVVRKMRAGMSPTHRPSSKESQQLYSEAASEALYEQLNRNVFQWLQQGRSVVVDAMFSRAAQRRRFLDVARRMGIPVALVHVHCPAELVHERMHSRTQDAQETSDADWTVYQSLAKSFETPDDVHPSLLLNYQSESPAGPAVTDVLTILARQGADGPVSRGDQP